MAMTTETDGHAGTTNAHDSTADGSTATAPGGHPPSAREPCGCGYLPDAPLARMEGRHHDDGCAWYSTVVAL